LIQKACELSLEMVSTKSRRRMSLYLYENLNYTEDVKLIKELKNSILSQNLKVPHFKACLDSVWVGIEENGILGLEEEHEQFLTCAYSDTSRALIHYFFSQRSVSKIPNLGNVSVKKINSICVIGGGLMGSGIATCCLLGDYKVVLKEVNEKFLNSGLERIKENLEKRLKSNRLTKEKFESLMSNLSGTIEYENFNQFDLVIEAVFENLELKQNIFETLERVCSKDCILASNTSTIDIDLIGKKTKCQSRIIGLHFFSPAHVMVSFNSPLTVP
jgi:enoyl-CoA hydratase/3-hydroxyacyl-CoA dehydrogenase